MNCQYVSNIVLTFGILSIINTVIYATTSSLYAINCGVNSCFLYLSNLNLVNGNDNSIAKINISATTYYSLNNIVFNKSTSLLLGISLSRIFYSDILYALSNINFDGSINNVTK